MVRRAPRQPPRPLPRRGGAVVHRALHAQPPVNGYLAVITSPANGFGSADRTPTVFVMGTSLAFPTVDLQIEWRRQEAFYVFGVWTPAAVYTVSVEDTASGVPVGVVPPTDLAFGTWWYRVRTGDSATNLWSDWSPQQWLDVRPVLGSLAEYVEMNIGVTDPPHSTLAAYIDMNVGLDVSTIVSELAAYVEMNIGAIEQTYQASEYADLNIGPKLNPYEVAEYMDFNVITNETPTPHIWWIRPEQGKEGYVFNIYGQGFGTFQNQYDGKVLLGNLVCSIARWEIVSADVVASQVEVIGKSRPTAGSTSGMAYPWVSLASATVTFEAGDTIDYDMRWDTPLGARLDIFPTFTQANTMMGLGANLLLNDDSGDPWISDQPEAYGAWHHRHFTVPAGHYLVGKAVANFGIAWYNFDATQAFRGGSIRSFVIRREDGTVKHWATGDDNLNAVPLVYTSNTGTLQSSTYAQAGYEISQGEGLDPDTITPEHGWIVAVVPSGAVSSMVRVVLEDD